MFKPIFFCLRTPAISTPPAFAVRAVYMHLIREGFPDALLPSPGLLRHKAVLNLLDQMAGEHGRFLTIENAVANEVLPRPVQYMLSPTSRCLQASAAAERVVPPG